jgi:hypothetical protein
MKLAVLLPLLSPALAAVEQCSYGTVDCSDAALDCVTLTDDMLKLSCASGYNYECSGDTLMLEYYGTTDCSDDVSAGCDLRAITDGTMPTGCHIPFTLGTCVNLFDITVMGVSIVSSQKFTGSCPASDDPCFSREAEACRILDTSASPSDAFRACFDEPTLKTAERVPMPALNAGDYVLSTGKDLAYEFTRIIVNQHRVEEQKRSGVVKITHATGELSLTPDHVLLVDGEWAAARTVKVGSSLSGSNVTAVSQGFGGIVNPLTTNGMIVAAGPTGKPVVASAYPEWIASYMLDVAVFPLPVSVSNLLSYLFPANVQAFYDQYLEGSFSANQSHLRKWKLGLPTLLVAPIILALDLLCAAGFVLYALASPKALAALAAVAVVACARRAKA